VYLEYKKDFDSVNPVNLPEFTEYSHATVHRIDLTGDYKTNIYTAARRLLEAGAHPGDTIQTYRDGQLSMSGVIGDCARLRVRESDHGNPSLRQDAISSCPVGPQDRQKRFSGTHRHSQRHWRPFLELLCLTQT
jgi:hypothetical protein